MLFSGFYVQFGGAFFIFGFPFFLVMLFDDAPAFMSLIMVLFPLVGLIFIIIGMRKNIRDIQLLIHGHLTEGKLIDVSATATRINEQTVYKYTFEFQPENGFIQTVVAKTHKGAKLEDEAMEPIMYLKEAPDKAVLLDNIHIRPKIQFDGSYKELPIWRMYTLILPLITIVGLGWYLWVKLGM